MMLYLVVVLLLLFVFLFFYWKHNFSYWKRCGVPHPPHSLIFGNLKEVILFQKSRVELFAEFYNLFEDLNYVGFYKLQRPALLIRNADLAKTILVKEFDCFRNNDNLLDENVDPFGKNPFVLKDERWKYVRQQLKSYFTPKKMRVILPIMDDVGKKMVSYIEMLNKCSKEEETKSIIMNFTIENVSASGFGIKANAFKEVKGEIVPVLKSIFDEGFGGKIKPLIFFIMPHFAHSLRLRLLPKKATQHFKRVFLALLTYRRANSVMREDYMNMLIEANNKNKFSEEDVVAQALSLFIDGSETSSQAIVDCLYELAINPQVQERLRDEIEENISGELTYDKLQKLKYLECVVKESLRLHPPLPLLSKVCTKPCKLPPVERNGEGPEIIIQPGTVVVIPVKSLHQDHLYYSDPMKFSPERFLADVNKGLWFAFGDGPRNCLGMRFGMLQFKIALIHIVRNFRIKLNERTMMPLQFDSLPLLDVVRGGIWLNFEKR